MKRCASYITNDFKDKGLTNLVDCSSGAIGEDEAILHH